MRLRRTRRTTWRPLVVTQQPAAARRQGTNPKQLAAQQFLNSTKITVKVVRDRRTTGHRRGAPSTRKREDNLDLDSPRFDPAPI
jgi:hypothetical protein